MPQVWGYNGASGTYDLVIESDCANSTAIVPVDVNSPVSISVDTDSPNLRAVTCQDVNVSTSLPTGGWYSFVGGTRTVGLGGGLTHFKDWLGQSLVQMKSCRKYRPISSLQ